jgi:hypothetical protein
LGSGLDADRLNRARTSEPPNREKKDDTEDNNAGDQREKRVGSRRARRTGGNAGDLRHIGFETRW